MTKSQIALLAKLIDGPKRLVGSEWQSFRTLEDRGYVVKLDMMAYATDLGRHEYHSMNEREEAE